MSHWILLEAEYPQRFEHVVIGPFADEATAVEHLQDSLQVEAMCQDDAIDAWTVDHDRDTDTAIGAWDAAGEPWGLYRPVGDDQGCTTGTPAGLALMPSGRLATAAHALGRAR
jgi:hypothetical protein